MIDTLNATAKQVGLELINMSETSENLQTWGDVLEQNPDSTTAALSAGFINKPSATSGLQMVIDVQTPPEQGAVLRTWAIETKVGEDGKEYFNNIQLTFEVDDQKARDLVTKGKAITREDIGLLLQNKASQLASIAVSKDSSGDETKQTHGERYDFTVAELSEHSDEAATVEQALLAVMQTLKQSL